MACNGCGGPKGPQPGRITPAVLEERRKLLAEAAEKMKYRLRWRGRDGKDHVVGYDTAVDALTHKNALERQGLEVTPEGF